MVENSICFSNHAMMIIGIVIIAVMIVAIEYCSDCSVIMEELFRVRSFCTKQSCGDPAAFLLAGGHVFPG